MSTPSTAEVLARSRALRSEAVWAADHTTPPHPKAMARLREMRRNHRLLLEEMQRRHDVTVSLSWIRNALVDIKAKDSDICNHLESMIDTIHEVKVSTPSTVPFTVTTYEQGEQPYILDIEKTEDYCSGSCSLPSEMSLPPLQCPHIDTVSIDKNIRKQLTYTFSEENEDLGVFV